MKEGFYTAKCHFDRAAQRRPRNSYDAALEDSSLKKRTPSLGDEVHPLMSLRAERSNLLDSCVEIATSPWRAPRNDNDDGSFPIMSFRAKREIPMILLVMVPSLKYFNGSDAILRSTAMKKLASPFERAFDRLGVPPSILNRCTKKTGLA